jgi:hypothetical protein
MFVRSFVCLFCGIFNDGTDRTASNDKGLATVWKEVVAACYFPGGTEEIYETPPL